MEYGTGFIALKVHRLSYVPATEQVHVASTLALELIDLITSDCRGRRGGKTLACI